LSPFYLVVVSSADVGLGFEGFRECVGFLVKVCIDLSLLRMYFGKGSVLTCILVPSFASSDRAFFCFESSFFPPIGFSLLKIGTPFVAPQIFSWFYVSFDASLPFYLFPVFFCPPALHFPPPSPFPSEGWGFPFFFCGERSSLFV